MQPFFHFSLCTLSLTSTFTVIAFFILSFVTEDDLILFERFYSVYVEAITKHTDNDPILIDCEKIFLQDDLSFPPNIWVVLEMFKAIGALFGMVSAKVILATLLWLVFEVRFQPPIPVDELLEEDEDEEVRFRGMGSFAF